MTNAATAYRISLLVLEAALRDGMAIAPFVDACIAAARALVASGEESHDAEHAAAFLRGSDA